MILHFDQWLFDTLSGLALYNPSQDGGVALTPAIDAPLPVGHVVRWNTSEYVQLYDDGTQPFVAIKPVVDEYEDPHRGLAAGARIWAYTDDVLKEEAAVQWHPLPLNLIYELEVVSPDDLWRGRIRMALARFFGRRKKIDLTVEPLGSEVGGVEWPTVVYMENVRHIGDLNGGGAMVRSLAEEQRFFRSIIPLRVETWLLSPDNLLEVWKVYKTAEVEVADLETDETWETVEIP